MEIIEECQGLGAVIEKILLVSERIRSIVPRSSREKKKGEKNKNKKQQS